MSRLVWMPRNVGPYSERVITAYGHGMRARLRVLRRLHVFAARHAACTLCVSEHSRTTLAQLARLPANTLALAPHGVTQQAAPSADQTRAVLNTCGIDRPFLLSVAHGYVYKNIVELVHAYALIREQRPDLLLVLAGGWPEADYRRRVDRAIAMHRSICHDIRLIGSRSAAELLALNHAAEVAVATSWLENCPNTLLEHMACGCAIVCSNEPPMPEHARDGATLVDVDDPRAIADAVLRLLGDASLKANLREKAKRRSADFSWDATEERTFDAICRVARQNGADVRE
jgi:glycosyltransferase involved in cell wall biosynthesis